MGECEIYKEERDVLEEMRKIYECDMEKFCTLVSSEKTIVILGEMATTDGEAGSG